MTIDIFCPRCDGDNLEKVKSYQFHCEYCGENFTVQALYTKVKSEELDKNNVISA